MTGSRRLRRRKIVIGRIEERLVTWAPRGRMPARMGVVNLPGSVPPEHQCYATSLPGLKCQRNSVAVLEFRPRTLQREYAERASKGGDQMWVVWIGQQTQCIWRPKQSRIFSGIMKLGCSQGEREVLDKELLSVVGGRSPASQTAQTRTEQ